MKLVFRIYDYPLEKRVTDTIDNHFLSLEKINDYYFYIPNSTKVNNYDFENTIIITDYIHLRLSNWLFLLNSGDANVICVYDGHNWLQTLLCEDNNDYLQLKTSKGDNIYRCSGCYSICKLIGKCFLVLRRPGT